MRLLLPLLLAVVAAHVFEVSAESVDLMTLAQWDEQAPGKKIFLWQIVSDCSVVRYYMPNFLALEGVYKGHDGILVGTTAQKTEAGVPGTGSALVDALRLCDGSCIM